MTDLQTIVTNPEGCRRLGEHLIMWAKTGRMRKPNEDKTQGWPPTLVQFMTDVGADWRPEDGSDSGADIQIPKRLKGIQFTQSNMETLLVRLPPAALVEASEQSLPTNPDEYGLPGFYKQIFDGELTNPVTIFQSRVGDYTIAHCK